MRVLACMGVCTYAYVGYKYIHTDADKYSHTNLQMETM